LFPGRRYHTIFTDSPFGLGQADSQHRQHAIIEQHFADLIDGPLVHRPSGKFNANAARLQLACTAHLLTRALGCLASPKHALARGATIRAQLIAVTARIARTGRGNITWHLPLAWPWETAWRNSFHTTHAPPAPTTPPPTPKPTVDRLDSKPADPACPKTSNTRSTRYRKNTSGYRQRFRARDHRVDHLPPWSIQVPGNKSENGRKRIGRGIAQQPVQGVNGKSRASKGVGFPRRDEVCRHLGMVPAQGESINADLLLDGRAVPESD
jgi:hypothetical protein